VLRKVIINPKLLFIETFLLGDLLYLGTLLQAVRAQCPTMQIDVLASNATRGFPFFREFDVTVHHFDFPWSHVGWHRHPLNLLQAMVALKMQYGQQFRDFVAFDPRGDIRHAMTASMLCPRRFIQYRSSAQWSDAWRGIASSHVFTNRQMFLRQIASEIGISHEAELAWPWLGNYRFDCLKNDSRRIVLAPEASNQLRFWTPKNWTLLSNRLRQSGWHVTLVVYDGKAMPDPASQDYDVIWRGSISDLVQLVGSARAVVAVDSFVGHLAAAVGTPVVSLFGPQLPECWRPWGDQVTTIMAQGFPCRPCNQKRCIRPHDNCMEAIQFEQVWRVLTQTVFS